MPYILRSVLLENALFKLRAEVNELNIAIEAELLNSQKKSQLVTIYPYMLQNVFIVLFLSQIASRRKVLFPQFNK
jgi:hypothetical protein